MRKNSFQLIYVYVLLWVWWRFEEEAGCLTGLKRLGV